MKHPFWIINLGLIFFVLFASAFVYFSRVKITARESIEPAPMIMRTEHKIEINIQKIYENDLFETYVKEMPKLQSIDRIIPFPKPPVQQKITVPKIIEPQFLDPLQITLMGIIVVGSNDIKNRAIIQEDKSKQESIYKVGDIIQDSQVIRIFKNKIILLRLNGQQEVLYLREQDAKNDASYIEINEWDMVIKKTGEAQYLLSPEAFIENVKTLTQFIEMLNTTTAYQKGKSVGLRIGQLSPQSLGMSLGLQKGDIIISINNIPTQTTEERLAIYKNITNLPLENTITVKLVRKNKEVTLRYTLDNFIKKNNEAIPLSVNQTDASLLFKNNINQQHLAFAPTINKIRKADHQIIREKSNISMNIDS